MDEISGLTFILYHEQIDALEDLSDEQLGRLIRCLDKYLFGTLKESEVDKDIRLVFKFMKTQINIDKKKYEKRVEKNKKAAAARWETFKKNAQSCICIRMHCIRMHKHAIMIMLMIMEMWMVMIMGM